MDVTAIDSTFRTFEANLRMSPQTIATVRYRYHSITKRINEDFWRESSENEHSLYAGSYGRGTSTSTSDIDILVQLPDDMYTNYWFRNALHRNGSSELLQSVKRSLQKTYATSYLSGDGQVVVVDFSDGIRFEVVPVFKYGEQLFFPDTHNGGSFVKMNPIREMDAFDEMNRVHPGGMKKLCRMMRAMRANFKLDLLGETIDSMVYEYWNQGDFTNIPAFRMFDYHTKGFFDYWKHEYRLKQGASVPGTKRHLEIPRTEFLSKLFSHFSEVAGNASESEIEKYTNKYWRMIYGDRFPA